jgi:antibiotic biosynthesis monooxygenase (ABM) superfamily enzyme
MMEKPKAFIKRLFEPSAEQVQLKALEELVEGCRRHPGYRYRRAPTARCKRCDELWEFKQRFEQWQSLKENQWKANMERERREMERRAEAREIWYNSPG